MSKSETFLCDNCEVESDYPLVYRLAQIVDDDSDEMQHDDDVEQSVETFDFCSSKCLHAWAMDMALDFPDLVVADTDI